MRYKIEVDPGNRPTLFEIIYNEDNDQFIVWQKNMKTGEDSYSPFQPWPPNGIYSATS